MDVTIYPTKWTKYAIDDTSFGLLNSLYFIHIVLSMDRIEITTGSRLVNAFPAIAFLLVAGLTVLVWLW